MFKHKPLLRDLGAVLLLWLAVVLFTWSIGPGGRVLAGGDVFTYFYPYWAEATRAIRATRLPLWNPFLFMGAPFLANSQVGFFYPPNWALWLAVPAYRSVHLTILLHLCLAALNAFVWGRGSLDLGRVGASTVGVVFAFSGYLVAQIEHVNQLQGLAWLPLMLTLYDQASDSRGAISRRRASFAGLAVVLALVLLAGHTQTGFISIFGLAVYGCGPAFWRAVQEGEAEPLFRRGLLLLVGTGIGMALAGAQMVPTWELSRHSVRARGLPLRERVSFSLSPLYVGNALLPRFVDSLSPDHMEHVAYVGVTGMALAVVGLAVIAADLRESRSLRQANPRSRNLAVLLLISLGLFFSLGLYNPVYLILAMYVPGFSHFRVPARWLALYVVGMSALAGHAFQAVWERRCVPKRAVLASLVLVSVLIVWAGAGGHWGGEEVLALPSVIAWVITLLLVAGILKMAPRAPHRLTLLLLVILMAELSLATTALPLARATASQAFLSLRPALAHLMNAEPSDTGPADRFLSMSDITFDPGDLSLTEAIYGPQLSDEQLYRYVIAAKEKEIASPNLPLAFGLPAVDGYDGGVLPLERFVMIQQLLLPREIVSIDGRLRENLTAVPEGRWLSLFNVRYLITDKLRDAWIDGVFYDLQHGASLFGGQEVAVAHVPRFQATGLSLVSYLDETEHLPDGTPVGTVMLGFESGVARTFELRVGEHVSRGELADGDEGQALTRLHWSARDAPLTVTFRGTLPEGTWVVRGVTLTDEGTGSFQSLVISDRGSFRLVHSGDVKVYENLDVLSRAFVVSRGTRVGDDQAALTAMKYPGFDPSAEAVMQGDASACWIPERGGDVGSDSGGLRREPGQVDVEIVQYHPEQVIIETHLEEAGYLILTDAWYPGWYVTVDGEQRDLCRANLLFRAVALDAGEHRVVFRFMPPSQAVGAVLSIIGLVLLVVVPALILRYPR